MKKLKLLILILTIFTFKAYSQITPQWKSVTGGLMSYFYPSKSPAGFDTLWNAQKIRSYIASIPTVDTSLLIHNKTYPAWESKNISLRGNIDLSTNDDANPMVFTNTSPSYNVRIGPKFFGFNDNLGNGLFSITYNPTDSRTAINSTNGTPFLFTTSGGVGSQYTPSNPTDFVRLADIGSLPPVGGYLAKSDTVTLARKTGNSIITNQRYVTNGTVGNGFFDMLSQSASPSSLTSHIRLYSDSLNRLSWKNSTYRRTIQVPYPTDYTIRMPWVPTSTTLVDSAINAGNINLKLNKTDTTAMLANVVHRAGVETITGPKTLTATLTGVTILPTVNNTSNLGSSSLVYATAFARIFQSDGPISITSGSSNITFFSSSTALMRVWATTGNVLVQTAGSFVDLGYKLSANTAGTNGYFKAGNLSVDASGIALNSSTPTQNDNSTKIATTAYVDRVGAVAGSFSGVGTATTTFTVTIGVTQSNTTYKVQVTPTSILGAAVFYINNKTTTTFDVVYMTGLTGTLTFDWCVFK